MRSTVENLILGVVTLLLILPLQAKSQSLNEENNTHVVIPSQDGALVLLFSAFNGHADKPLSEFQKIVISKQEGSTKHRKVAEVKIPKTEAELTARFNDLQPDAARMMDLKSNQDLFDLFSEMHPLLLLYTPSCVITSMVHSVLHKILKMKMAVHCIFCGVLHCICLA